MLALFGVYLTLSIWVTWPLAVAGSERMLAIEGAPGVGGELIAADLDLVIWSLAWVSHALVAQPFELFDANAFYPAPRSLAFSEHFFGLQPLFAPPYWLSESPVVAANLSIVLILALRGLAMAMFLGLFVSVPAAFAAGFLYAFPPSAIDGLPKFYMEATFYLPLAFWCLERWLDEARLRHVVGLAACLAMQALVSNYLAWSSAIAFMSYLAITLTVRRHTLDRRRWLGLVAAGCGSLLFFSIFAWPYLSLIGLGILPDNRDPAFLHGLGLHPAIALSKIRSFFFEDGGAWFGFGLALVGLILGQRVHRRVAWAALLIVALGTLLAAGPNVKFMDLSFGGLYLAAMQWLPGFAGMRVSFRFLSIVVVGLAILAGLGLDRLMRISGGSSRRGWALALALVALDLALVSRRPIRLEEVPLGEGLAPVYKWLADNGEGGALIELPLARIQSQARRQLTSTAHWLPMVGGYSGHVPDSSTILYEMAAGLPRASALQSLLDVVDLRWVVVHEKDLAPAARQAWTGPIARGLEPVGRFGDARLFRVVAQPATHRRELLLSKTLTLDGRQRELLQSECPGRIELISSPSRESFGNFWVWALTVRIHNDGDRDWAGLGAIPRLLVRLRVCPQGEDRPCAGKGLRLSSDVPAGESIVESVRAVVPSPEKAVIVELFQADGLPLAECGVSKLLVSVP
jgi:hypothetical protein